MIFTVAIDSLADCLFLEGGFGGQLLAAEQAIKESARLAIDAVILADVEKLAELQKALTDALDQIQSVASAKTACAAYRKGLETPVPTTPVEPPVVIELPAPVEPTPVEETPVVVVEPTPEA